MHSIAEALPIVAGARLGVAPRMHTQAGGPRFRTQPRVHTTHTSAQLYAWDVRGAKSVPLARRPDRALGPLPKPRPKGAAAGAGAAVPHWKSSQAALGRHFTGR